MDVKLPTRLLAGGRVAIGLALFLAPATAGRAWLGDVVDDAGAKIAIRGLGARDLTIGVATLVALEDDGPPLRWLEAGIVADLADATAVLLARRERPASVVAATLALAGGAAAFGGWLRQRAAGAAA